MSRGQKIIGVGIVILAAILRLINLDKVPVSLSNDEISIAYDAYSIRETGRDEHNEWMPVAFKSHGTYKAPLYGYTAVVTNYILGNSEISVRLPSAIMGILAVALLGWWVFLVSGQVNLALITGAVLAVSPSHIYSSRMALESNMASFYLLLGISLITWSMAKNRKVPIILALLAFGLSVWSYHTEWLLTPLIIGGIFIFYYQKLAKNIFWWMGIVAFGAMILPIADNAWRSQKTTARANTEIILKDPGVAAVVENKTISVDKKVKVVAKAFFSNYSNYTKLGTLFFEGTPLLPKEDPYTIGLFLVPCLPFFIWGLFKIKDYLREHGSFLYYWWLSCPIIPSLTIGGVNLVRNLAVIMPMTIVIAIGIDTAAKKMNRIVRGGVVGVFLISFVYFLVIYYYHFPKETGENFQYGYKQAAEFINQNEEKYETIVVEPRFGKVNLYVGVPHLYLAYFTNLEPQALLARREGNPKGLYFDKYQIREINWGIEEIKPKTLYLAPFDNLPNGDANKKLRTIKEIRLPEGTVEFKLLTAKDKADN